MTFDFAYPNTPADERGWGPGWQEGMPIGRRPTDYPGVIVPLAVGDVTFIGGVRAEVHDLLVLLLEESLRRGYIPKLDSPGCYGLAFRPTKRSDGTYTTTPSNHSWGLAVDINAPHNVYGSTQHQIPQAMADLWRSYGWRWLGPPIKDWQHFDFAGTPADAKAMTLKARRDLTSGENDMANADDWIAGFEAFVAGADEPADGWQRRGFRRAKNLYQQAVRDAQGSSSTITVHIPAQDVNATVTS